MPKYMPISVLKNTREAIACCKEQDEPVFVIRNGTPEAVLISMDYFEKHLQFKTTNGKVLCRKQISREARLLTLEAIRRESKGRTEKADEP